MKYLIVDEDGLEQPIVFPEILSHKAVAGLYFQNGCVVAAGFCYRMGDFWSCSGKSVGLGLKSRGDMDAELLNTVLEKTA
jgi:hypothetical protein